MYPTIVFLPLLGFLVAGLFGRRLGPRGAQIVTSGFLVIAALLAMIGAIVLAHRTRPGVKKQNIAEQVARTPAETIELIKVETGKGVKM